MPVSSRDGYRFRITLDDRVTKRLRFISNAIRGIARSALNITRSLYRIGLVGVGALTALGYAAVRVANSLDKISKASDLVGVSTKYLQVFGRIGEEFADINFKTTIVGIRRFARRIGEVDKGTGELLKTWQTLGIALHDANGQIRPTVDLLKDYADAIANAESHQEKLLLSFKAFDSEGAPLGIALGQGADFINRFTEAYEGLGLVIDDEVLEDATSATDAFSIFGTVIKVVGQNLIAGLLPAITKLVGALTSSLIPAAAVARDTLRFDDNFLINGILKVTGALEFLVQQFIAAGNFAIDFSLKAVNGIDSIARVLNALPGVDLGINPQDILQLGDRLRELEGIESNIETILEGNIPANLESFYRERLGVIRAEMTNILSAVENIAEEGDTGFFSITQSAREYLGRVSNTLDDTSVSVSNFFDTFDQYLVKFRDSDGYTGGLESLFELYSEGRKQFQDAIDGSALEDANARIENTLATGIKGALDAGFREGLSGVLDYFANALQNAVFGSIAQGLTDALGLRNAAGGFFSFLFGGARAGGGAVAGGTGYLVGERGPELFVPNTSGVIVPNNSLGGGINVTNNNSINTNASPEQAAQFAQQISDATVLRIQDLRARGRI